MVLSRHLFVVLLMLSALVLLVMGTLVAADVFTLVTWLVPAGLAAGAASAFLYLLAPRPSA